MKTRLTCRVIRTWSALRETPPAHHLATCADCAAFFRRSATLHDELRRDALRSQPAVPSTLEHQILRAVRESKLEDTAPAGTPLPWRSLASFGAVAAIVVLGAIAFHRGAAPQTRNGDVALTAADATAIVSTVESLSNQLVETVIPSAGSLIADNPLQSELGAVYSDAKSALDFLALNFLPRTTATASTTPPRRTG